MDEWRALRMEERRISGITYHSNGGQGRRGRIESKGERRRLVRNRGLGFSQPPSTPFNPLPSQPCVATRPLFSTKRSVPIPTPRPRIHPLETSMSLATWLW